MARDTHTYCSAFSSGVVTTCFYALGLSRLRFEHPTFRRGKDKFDKQHNLTIFVMWDPINA